MRSIEIELSRTIFVDFDFDSDFDLDYPKYGIAVLERLFPNAIALKRPPFGMDIIIGVDI